MKYNMVFSITLCTVLIFAACSDNIVSTGLSGDLEGTWVFKSYENENYTLKRSFSLAEDKAGIIFFRDGKLIERKNIGWCGTPPVVYDNYTGNWYTESDNKLKISVGFWGGTETYKLEIVLLSESDLVFKKSYLN